MDIKQVIVIRKDLKIRRGKEIAQGSHSSLMFLVNKVRAFIEYQNNSEYSNSFLSNEFNECELQWMENSFTKICLQVNSEEELDNIYNKAKEAGLEVNMVIDSGRTEFDGIPTKTCLAIGPDESSKIDLITSNLKLY